LLVNAAVQGPSPSVTLNGHEITEPLDEIGPDLLVANARRLQRDVLIWIDELGD
jgi:hypothetical protein